MMKISLLGLFFALSIFPGIAQPRELWLKNDKGLYLDHKVVSKENFYSVGRLYNVPAKEIAAYNKLDMNKGLNVDQVIRIPLSAANFSQTVNEGAPVYYKVKEDEGLMKVSSVANNVPLANLRRWNSVIKNDKISPGNKLIVGFLISSQLPSITINQKEAVSTPNAQEKDVKEVKKDPPVVTSTQPSVTNIQPSVTITQQPATSSQQPVTSNQQPVTSNQQPTSEGYFKSSFEQQLKTNSANKSETITSGIFKTTSGWQDAKYYLLIDAVQPGTIVKVVNPSNNKTVYAKVLGEMTGIRQNEGLNMRMSSAAAAALQVTEQDKFVVKVNW